MQKNFLLLCLLLSLFSCKSQPVAGLTDLDPAAFRDSLQKNEKAQLIDVRSPGEFAEGSIPGARNIDVEGTDFESATTALDKNRPVFLFCQSGNRSRLAAKILAQKGFTSLYHLEGGYKKWKSTVHSGNTAAPGAKPWKGMSLKTFDSLCNGPLPVLFDFQATWCVPCKKLKPVLEAVEKEYAGQLIIFPVDIDTDRSLANHLNISAIPFLKYYKEGKLLMNIEGLTDKKNLVSALGLKK